MNYLSWDKYEDLLRRVINGEIEVNDVYNDLKFQDFNFRGASFEQTKNFTDIVLALKAAQEKYLALKKSIEEKPPLSPQDSLKYLYSSCSKFIKYIDYDGVYFSFNGSFVIENEVYDSKEMFLEWEDLILINKIISFFNKDSVKICDCRLNYSKTLLIGNVAFNYVYQGDINIAIKNYFPSIREAVPDKYYGFLHFDRGFYTREHYIGDVFKNLLKKVHSELVPLCVIFDPFGPNIKSYVKMGFSIYISNTVSKDDEFSSNRVYDLTGKHVLFDPLTFTTKYNNDINEHLEGRMRGLTSSSLSLNYSRHLKLNVNTWSYDFSQDKGRKMFLLLGHKPCFYSFDSSLVSGRDSGEVFTVLESKKIFEMGSFFSFMNCLRNYMISVDLNKLKKLEDIVKDMLTDQSVEGTDINKLKSYWTVLTVFSHLYDFERSEYNFIDFNNDDRRLINSQPNKLLTYSEKGIGGLYGVVLEGALIGNERGIKVIAKGKHKYSFEDGIEFLKTYGQKGGFMGLDVKNKMFQPREKFFDVGPVLYEDKHSIQDKFHKKWKKHEYNEVYDIQVKDDIKKSRVSKNKSSSKRKFVKKDVT